MPTWHTDEFELIELQNVILIKHGPSGRRFYCHLSHAWRVTEIFGDGSSFFISERDGNGVAKAALAFAREHLKDKP